MNAFATDWLALREPADHRARNRLLTGRLAARFQERPGLRLVDLGSGTGSTVRALADLLPGPQIWRLVDYDAGHLDRARELLDGLADRDGRSIAVETMVADLASEIPPSLFDGVDLVTTSAFFDLVSRPFLERLAQMVTERGLVLYAALSVDGRLDGTPPDALDTAVFDAFNAHMARDKGFGPALGPKAADAMVAMLRGRGYRVEVGRSDWRIGADESELAGRLLDGWATAAGETGLLDAAELARWTRRRQAEIAAGTATFGVGHIDLLATPD